MSSNSVLIIVNCRQQKIRVRTRIETAGHTVKSDMLCDIRQAEYYVTLITLRNNLNGSCCTLIQKKDHEKIRRPLT